MANKRVSQLPKITDRLELTSDDYALINNADATTSTVDLATLSNAIGVGYGHTGGFEGKPSSNSYVWEAGEGIRFTQANVNSGNYIVLSLDETVHNAVDGAYWSVPDVSGLPNTDLFNGYANPIGVDTLFDYTSSFDATYPTLGDFTAQTPSSNAQTSYDTFSGSTGRIKLNGLKFGDQLRVRFDFNIIPQIANTTIEPALWYSNRNTSDKETFSFALTTSPVFYGLGTPGNTYLNRVEISAWIISEEDVNAYTLPAIKGDNPFIIQPLGMLVTILR